jgi:hypothetical protein
LRDGQVVSDETRDPQEARATKAKSAV